MASADYINFATRPNKAVERKVVFDGLLQLARKLPFAEYRYIGFGALWFVDFVMAHHRLSIQDMVSIEGDDYVASRAEFNRPFACVSVEHGESETVLPQLQLEEKRALVWLDYDTSLDGPVLRDLATLCQRVPLGSVLMVTINAHKGSLPDADGEGMPLEGLEERLRHVAGDLIPTPLPMRATQRSEYPAFLAGVLFRHIRRRLRRAGRETAHVVPVFNIVYADNAPMTTIGVVVADDDGSAEVRGVISDGSGGPFADENSQLVIDVPPLTYREKMALDQLLPRDDPPPEDMLQKLGFRLKPSQVRAYHRFYRYYPTFGELIV